MQGKGFIQIVINGNSKGTFVADRARMPLKDDFCFYPGTSIELICTGSYPKGSFYSRQKFTKRGKRAKKIIKAKLEARRYRKTDKPEICIFI